LAFSMRSVLRFKVHNDVTALLLKWGVIFSWRRVWERLASRPEL
jgi:hypothetical protein